MDNNEEIELHDALGAVFGKGLELFDGCTIYNLDREEPEPEGESETDGHTEK